MTGLNRHTGGAIDGDAQLAQNLADLFSTPTGSRVMRRDYGSLLPFLVDAPQNKETALLLCAAAARAVNRWVRQIRVTRVQTEFTASGRGSLVLTYVRTDRLNATPASLAIPL
jgi:uncharacterized protein